MRVSIAGDLIQGQGEHTATRELLKQYAPLEGVITTPAGDRSPRTHPVRPVEKGVTPNATVAPPATEAPYVTLARLAMVEGELRVPNTITFSLFPRLDPFAKSRLLPTVPSLAWLQARHPRCWPCEVGEVSPHVSEKGPGHNRLPGKEGADQAPASAPRRTLERECLPIADPCRRHGARLHRGK